MSVVARRGARLATAGKIIEVAGVGRNTFYEHFETSGAAVAEAVGRAVEEARNAIGATVREVLTPRERLKALSVAWLVELSRRDALVAVLLDGTSEERASILRMLEIELRSALELARRSGAVGVAPEAFRLGCVLGAFVAGLEHVVTHPTADVRSASDALADLALRAFR